MKKPLYNRIIYVELKDGYSGYYERFAYADTQLYSNGKKPKLLTGYRTMFPSTDNRSFIELKDIKYWTYVFASSGKGYVDSKGHRNISKERQDELYNNYKAYEENFFKNNFVHLQESDNLIEALGGSENVPDAIAWNNWVESDPVGVCDFITTWISGLWWADGEIENPCHCIGKFWRAGFKEAVRLIHEGKMEVERKEK